MDATWRTKAKTRRRQADDGGFPLATFIFETITAEWAASFSSGDVLIFPTNVSAGMVGVTYVAAAGGVPAHVELTAIGRTVPFGGSAYVSSNFMFANGSKLQISNSGAAETFAGTASGDGFYGGDGNDSLSGGGGDDVLQGDAGGDALDGGAGLDTASYAGATGGVTVSLQVAGAQAVGGGEGTDTLVSIENLTGGAFNDSLLGESAANTLMGGSGADTLDGAGGDDVLQGGGGDDRLVGGGGVDVASYATASSGVTVSLAVTTAQAVGGGMGTDTLVSVESLVGSAYGDTLSGGATPLSLMGGAGDDSLVGGAGADTLDGDLGYDTISGGAGDDLIIGGPQFGDVASYVTATSGVSVNLSMTGPQAVGGGMGTDTLDRVEGAIGSIYGDTLVGSRERDGLWGDDGGDSLVGGAAADTIDGGAGNDTIAGESDDVINGGFGFDFFTYGNTGDSMGGKLDLSMTSVQSLGGFLGNVTIRSIEGVIGSAFNDTFIGQSAEASDLRGGGGDDYLRGGTGADTFDGGFGNDTIVDGAGDDFIDGGAGNDFVSFAFAESGVNVGLGIFSVQTVGADMGADSFRNLEGVIGSNFGDQLGGRISSDTLMGGAGADTLLGTEGDDHMIGGSGLDFVSYANASSGVTVNLGVIWAQGIGGGMGADAISGVEGVYGSNNYGDTLTGDSGANTLMGYGGDDSLSETGNSGASSLAGDAGNDYLRAAGGDDSLMGDAGNDTVVDTGGHNYLRGGDGSDSMFGGSDFDDLHGNMGNDTEFGNAGDDWVVGGQGNDLLSGDAGGDIVYGNLGNDTQFGGDGFDWVRGGQGNDSLDGGAGDDWIWGDRGDDTVTGGAGADVFHIFTGGGLDRVTDFSSAQGDRVVIDYGTYTVSQVGADTVVDLGGGDRMVLVGVTASTLPTGWITTL